MSKSTAKAPSERSKVTKRILIGVGITLVLVYIVFLFITTNFLGNNNIVTETAYKAKAYDIIESKALIVRDEEYLKSDASGVMVYDVSDGGKVTSDGVVATAYNSQEDVSKVQQIKELDERIAYLKSLNEVNNSTNVGIDTLNSQINDLRAQLADAQGAAADANSRLAQLQGDLANANKALAQCKNDLNAAKNAAPKVVDNSKQYMNILVHFPKSGTAITADQRANVERVAAYLKSHPEATCEIKGYASPEGKEEVNVKLAEGRAASVKDMLVKKYGIAANRINAAGQGISNMFDELSWNRVSICEIIVK